MTERASVFEKVQIGIESTPGTAVAANRYLEALSIDPDREGEIEVFRPEGQKFATAVSVGKENTTAGISGILDYNCIIYPLASVLAYATPAQVGTLSAYDWTFTPDTFGPDTVKTYTVEVGSSVRAQKFAHGIVTGLNWSFAASDPQIELAGDMLGADMEDGIAMTSTPTVIAAVPVSPKHCVVRVANTQAAVGTTTPLSRLLAMDWSVAGKYGPVFTVGTHSSFVATVELAPDPNGSFTVAADSEGMAFLTDTKAGTKKWMQVEFNGGVIAGTASYRQIYTMPVFLTEYPPLDDNEGVVAAKYSFQMAHDSTWGKALTVTVRNGLSAL